MGLLAVILGMHRSGTSFTANALHRAGMYLGPDLHNSAWPGNLEGHAESWEALQINSRILELSGGDWMSPPAELECNPAIFQRLTTFVADLQKYPVAGWKEPQTTLTFPLWKPLLNDYRIIACFRHPINVARSLHARDGLPIERSLSCWAIYNERLLEHATQESDCYWVNFDSPAAELNAQIQVICSGLGLQTCQEGLATFNTYLRHHTELQEIADERLKAIYERLLEKAGDAHARLRNKGKMPTLPAASGSILEEVQKRLEQLGRVVELQDQLIQNALNQAVPRLSSTMIGLQEKHGQLEQAQGRLEQAQGRLEQAQGRLEQAQGQLEQAQGQLEQKQGQLEENHDGLWRKQIAMKQTQEELYQQVARWHRQLEPVRGLARLLIPSPVRPFLKRLLKNALP